MASLKERLLKTTTLEYADVLDESVVFNDKEFVHIGIPALDIAYSGDIDGGISSGLYVWAGPSRMGKSIQCMIAASAYMAKHQDAIMLFYDNEFGTPKAYFDSLDIDKSRVLHMPFLTLEDLRTDITNQLNEIKRGDKVIIVVDSLGLAASNKEVKDAEDGSDKADMTRAKVNKSLFRIVTPHLKLKDVPMFVVQHTYDTMEMYSKKIVSGGQGTMLAADCVFILGRQQDKDGKDLMGYDFIINVEKSRFVKDKVKIPLNISRKSGVGKWSGLWDIAVEGGFIQKVTAQSYTLIEISTGEVLIEKFKKSGVEHSEAFWTKVFDTTTFKAYVKEAFGVSSNKLISDTVEPDTDEEEADSEE